MKMSSLSNPFGLGADWVTHLAPFQASARKPFEYPPTAKQALGDEHDTPLRYPRIRPGDGAMAHFVPFQTSTRANPLLGLVEPDPTAMQVLGDVHDTLARFLRVAPQEPEST